jgi:hypothetical protein
MKGIAQVVIYAVSIGFLALPLYMIGYLLATLVTRPLYTSSARSPGVVALLFWGATGSFVCALLFRWLLPLVGLSLSSWFLLLLALRLAINDWRVASRAGAGLPQQLVEKIAGTGQPLSPESIREELVGERQQGYRWAAKMWGQLIGGVAGVALAALWLL